MFWCFEYKKAKIIIDEWIENGDKTAMLCLSHLTLKKLPALPPNLQKLNCSYCSNLKEISKLPESLQELYYYGCPIEKNTKITGIVTSIKLFLLS